LCDEAGTVVAAAHAGWRGLCDGVIERTVAAMDCPPHRLLAWLGPAIGPTAFELGGEVRDAFISHHAADASEFSPRGPEYPDKFLADIYGLAKRRLVRAGVVNIFGGGFCTVTDPTRFFSYRRNGKTGRMAAVVWVG
ncbi:MAG: laccase domain-containing protein, partial [Betaproteobacteria bacterium]|nr:laccase domain-containing protein [Betaproteobacteria bacterium]